MHVLPLPKNFLEPQSMQQSPVPTWIREESERIVGYLEEEIKRRHDPDNPFDGTASGIFNPLEHDTRTSLIPLLEQKKPFQRKRKTENSWLSLPNTDVNDEARTSAQRAQLKQQKETLHSEPSRQAVQNGKSDYSKESPQGRRQMERNTTQTNPEVQTHAVEERLIDYPFVPQSRQMVINEVPSSSGRKSKKSCYSPNQWTQPQSFEVSRGQQEVRTEATPGIQQRSNYSQQLSPQGVLQVSHVRQEQPTGEEYDPFHKVRSFHRRQKELIAQLPIPSTPSPETGGTRQPHINNYSGFMQETPKLQRERREKHRTFQKC